MSEYAYKFFVSLYLLSMAQTNFFPGHHLDFLAGPCKLDGPGHAKTGFQVKFFKFRGPWPVARGPWPGPFLLDSKGSETQT